MTVVTTGGTDGEEDKPRFYANSGDVAAGVVIGGTVHSINIGGHVSGGPTDEGRRDSLATERQRLFFDFSAKHSSMLRPPSD